MKGGKNTMGNAAVLAMPRIFTSAKEEVRGKGFLITLEGGEGSGKSTQMNLLYEAMLKVQHEVIKTREPWGEYLRKKLLHGNLSPEEELQGFIDDRRQHVREVIVPALKKGVHVICDRFSDSTIAFQHYGRGLDLHLVEKRDKAARQGILPRLTILLDVSPAVGLARKGKQGIETRFERENLAFHTKVRNGYLAIAEKEPWRVFILDGEDSIEHIRAWILEKVFSVLR